MAEPIRKVVITGDNLASWQCALSLKKLMPFVDLDIRVVSKREAKPELNHELRQDDTVIVATPTMAYFHRLLGIDERVFMQRCDARFHLANAYEFDNQRSFYLGYAESVCTLDGVTIQHLVSRLASELSGNETVDADLSISTLSAESERAAKFGFSKNPEIAEQLAYGYCFSSAKYTKYIAELAKQSGVQVTQVDTFHWQGADDNRYELSCTEGEIQSQISADFFIDCSSDASMFESFIPIVTVSEQREIAPKVDVSAELNQGGGSDKHSVQYRFDDKGLTIEALSASSCFTRSLALVPLSSTNSSGDSATANSGVGSGTDRFESTLGYQSSPWQGNRLLVGSSAAKLGDLAIPAVQLVQSSILRLLDLFPNDSNMSACAQEFNDLSQQEFERVMEFHLAQLHAPELAGSRPKDYLGQAGNLGQVGSVLENKLSVFKASGVFPVYEGESVSTDIWVSLLLNCGVIPEYYDPVLDNYPISEVRAFLSQQAKLIASTVAIMPPHDQYLAQYLAQPVRGKASSVRC